MVTLQGFTQRTTLLKGENRFAQNNAQQIVTNTLMSMKRKQSKPLLLRSFVTAITSSAEGSSGDSRDGSLDTTRVLNVVFNDDWK